MQHSCRLGCAFELLTQGGGVCIYGVAAPSTSNRYFSSGSWMDEEGGGVLARHGDTGEGTLHMDPVRQMLSRVGVSAMHVRSSRARAIFMLCILLLAEAAFALPGGIRLFLNRFIRLRTALSFIGDRDIISASSIALSSRANSANLRSCKSPSFISKESESSFQKWIGDRLGANMVGGSRPAG
jgi:hypothetical protein